MSLKPKFEVKDLITRDLTAKIRELEQVPKKVYIFFRAHTPIRSGNARKNTFLKGDEIQARYPYALRLDQGWSKQAPDGMTKPTQEYHKSLLDQIFRKR